MKLYSQHTHTYYKGILCEKQARRCRSFTSKTITFGNYK